MLQINEEFREGTVCPGPVHSRKVLFVVAGHVRGISGVDGSGWVSKER
jgi:hypothetical protein